MSVIGKFPNQVSADPEGLSLVSGQTWDVIVTSLDSNGNPRSGDAINVYDFDINTGNSNLLASGVTASNGEININCPAIDNVASTQASRLIRITDETAGEYSDYYVPLWFHVYMTLECYTTNLYCYPYSATDYVALPAPACNNNVYVYTTTKGNLVSEPVMDLGPGNTDDPYWNGSGQPKWINPSGYHVGMDGSANVWAALGFTNGVDYSCSGGYGLTKVYWRFK